MTTMTAIGAKLVELFRDTNSWVLPNKDFIIISDTSDIEEIEQKANELFPEGNLGDPWTMDDISHEITGATDNWGYADEWTYCAHCYKPINMYGSYYLPESWFLMWTLFPSSASYFVRILTCVPLSRVVMLSSLAYSLVKVHPWSVCLADSYCNREVGHSQEFICKQIVNTS